MNQAEELYRTNIPVIAFAGYSGSGKTTLIESLIPELKGMGLRVAVIKHDGHRFEIDHEGKDSWRFVQAGADITVIASGEQTAYIARRETPLAQLLCRIRDVDLILVEGYKNEPLPQIGVARSANEKGFTADTGRFIALVTDLEVDTDLPCFGFRDIRELSHFILKRIQKAAI